MSRGFPLTFTSGLRIFDFSLLPYPAAGIIASSITPPRLPLIRGGFLTLLFLATGCILPIFHLGKDHPAGLGLKH